MFSQNRHPLRRLGCSACGCITLVIVLVVLACMGLFALVQSARAATPRHYVLLIDQSNSMLNRSATRGLVRDTALATLDRLAQPDRTVQVYFFGASVTAVITAGQSSGALLDTALEQSTSLGGTSFLTTLTQLFDQSASSADVVLITDGIPDPVEDPRAYQTQMRVLAQQFAQREIVVSALLIGPVDGTDWLTMWQDFAAITGGVAREIRSTSEVHAAVVALPGLALAPTSTPIASLTPMRVDTPTVTPTVTATLKVTAISTPNPAAVATLIPPQPKITPALPWAILIVGTIGVMGGLGWLVVMARKRTPPAAPANITDEGTLEIFDPDREASQRADLHTMGLGEVWGIGGDLQCRIHVEGAEPIEQAAVIMTPDGPLLETRGTPLSWEGRVIQTHLLFDGDELYLGRLILTYQNFFRQRRTSEGDDEVGER